MNAKKTAPTEQPPYVAETLQRAMRRLGPDVARLSIPETYAMVWLCLDKLADFRNPESIAEWTRKQADRLERGLVH